MFRTPSGQTGTDAYIFEATAIANARRELDARAARLAAAMADELSADVVVKVSIASAQFPNATLSCDRDGLARMFPMLGTARDAETLADYARGIADPNHVVRS